MALLAVAKRILNSVQDTVVAERVKILSGGRTNTRSRTNTIVLLLADSQTPVFAVRLANIVIQSIYAAVQQHFSLPLFASIIASKIADISSPLDSSIARKQPASWRRLHNIHAEVMYPGTRCYSYTRYSTSLRCSRKLRASQKNRCPSIPV